MDQIKSEQFVELAYEEYDGTDEMMPPFPPVVIVHGIFDCKDNWKEIAETIADKTIRKVYSIDLRNHGDSPHIPTSSIYHAIGDLEKLIQKFEEPVILIGHSIGGMFAMDIAIKKPHLIKKLILIDISPLSYPLDTEQHIILITELMKDIINNFSSKIKLYEAEKQIEKILRNNSVYPSLCRIILSNLMQDDEGIKWRCNVDIIQKGSIDNLTKKLYPFCGVYLGQVVLIYSTSANYVRKEDYEKIKNVFPNIDFRCVNDCTHWIHMDKKEELLNHILSFINK